MMHVKVKPNIVQMEEGKASAWDHHDNRPKSSFRKLLKPSLVSLSVCGCYTYDADYVNTGIQRPMRRRYRVFSTIYRTIILFVCLAACTKAIAAFWTLPPGFIEFNVIILAWFMEILTVFLIFLKSNHVKYGGQRKAFDLWDDTIRPELDDLGIEFPEKKVKRRQKIYLILATMVSIVNVSGAVLMSTDLFSEGFGAFFASPFAKSVTVLVFVFIVYAIVTLIWILPVFHIIQVSTILIATFEVFNEYLENHIKQNSIAMTCLFQKIRQLHLNLCKMISHLDQDFGCFFAAVFVFSVGIACFNLYVILKIPMNTLDLIMFFFWLTSILAFMGGVSVFAAFVNDAVSRIHLEITTRIEYDKK